MKVSYKWLKRYVDLNIDAQELARRFTFSGLEVEDVEEIAADISGVVVARVLQAVPHPHSDHISICRVDDGSDIYTVLCGAPNVVAEQIIPLAKIGALLPGNVKITAKQALGMESQGMICSKAELGIDKNDQDGIWVLPADLTLGADIVEALDLRDSVLNIALTPNRSDCLGLLNCAYEAAAHIGAQVKEPPLDYAEDGPPIGELLHIEVADAAICPRYVGRLALNVKIGPSPLWMQNYLLAAGMRPINNVVDISNFVMLEMNQPLHAFDYEKLAQRRIIVRAAQAGETMQTLDSKERLLNPGDILICDGVRAVCIGGVMGGMDTEVTEQTIDVLIESACFNPVHIRRTARRLGIPSEASQRFEKGIDIANCDKAARRAMHLLVEHCGATAAQGVLDVGGQDVYAKRQIKLRRRRVNDLLGVAYSMEEITRVMDSLSFDCMTVGNAPLGAPLTDTDESITVSIPSCRQDITLEEDLIEEVARLRGYDSIPATLPASAARGYLSEQQQQRRRLRDLNAALGLSEAVNYSFISPREADKLLLPPEHPWRKPLAIANPLNEEQSVMRMSLLPGLLNCAARNIGRRNLDIALFELGSVYIPSGPYPTLAWQAMPAAPLAEGQPTRHTATQEGMVERQPVEIPSWSLLLCGHTPSSWQKTGHAYDYFYAKGIIETVAAAMDISGLTFERAPQGAFPYLHPGRSALISLNGRELGFIGELDPRVAGL
ncbi:MAG: phenylalanine--tRNA ligase subunit beta, partial [Clostridiales bacterium]|nr:phenylalanine--tRNA ligase subunit beta [Clostridiales bacterium]